jgi:thioredoxin reductase (NADPH)
MAPDGWRQREVDALADLDTTDVERVIILGSGVAGLTAAVYTARGNLRPLVIEGGEPGGQLSLTSTVENFPGFPDGIGGLDLIQAIRSQAERFGARYRGGEVTRVDLGVRPFLVELDGSEELRAHSLIIATGARARLLGLEGEDEILGRGLSTCATCDGAFFKGRTVAVVGGGDSAMEDAIYLTRFARQVHVVHRRDRLRASKIMQDRAFQKESITFHWNRVVEAYLRTPDGRLRGLALRGPDGTREELEVDGVFLAIGHIPNTDMLRGQLPADADGYLTPRGVLTDIPGVFVAGDVADRRYQQAATAAGTGCAAAMEAEDYLEAAGLAEAAAGAASAR